MMSCDSFCNPSHLFLFTFITLAVISTHSYNAINHHSFANNKVIKHRHHHALHLSQKNTQDTLHTKAIAICPTPSNLLDRRIILQKTAALSTIIFIPNLPPPSNAVTTTKISPLVTLPNTKIKIPRVGYSLYKTDKSQVDQCVNLALNAGIRHFDIATLYGTSDIVGNALNKFITNGLPKIDDKGFSIEEDERSSSINNIINQKKRRKELFISHKLSNEEQSTDISRVEDNIYKQIEILNAGNDNNNINYLDMVSIHSPLTDKERRISTYKALLKLQNEGIIKSIGVCNYGINPLNEIIDNGLPPPSVVQLQLSPFNQRKEILEWTKRYGCILSCSAWSKLSSVDGPQEGWAILSDIAKKKGMTKAQVLVQWSLQKGYICVPRSGSGSKIERKAIYENSYQGVNDKNYYLTNVEMSILDGLDENLKSGRLGVLDGWGKEDITGSDWDPTLVI